MLGVIRNTIYSSVTAFLLVLIGLPILFFVWMSFWSEPPGLGGEFTLRGFRLLFRAEVYGTIYNTAFIAVVGTAVSLAVGIVLVILTTKTQFPGKRYITMILIIQYLLPSFIQAIAWSYYIGTSFGLNWFLMQLPFIDRPVLSIYNVWGIALIAGLHYAGLVYLLVNSSISSIPSALEEAGLVEGAHPRTIFSRITLPLVFPAVSIAAILVFARLVQSFGIPIILGFPGRVFVLATHMYWAVAALPIPDYTFAGAMGMVILVLTLLTLLVQRRFLGQREKYETITGGGERLESLQFELGRYRPVIVAGTWGFILLFYVLPLVPLVMVSFQDQSYGMLFVEAQLTLENYANLVTGFRAAAFKRAYTNTLVMAGVGGLVAMSLATIASYVIVKTDSRLGVVLDYLTFAPAAIPGIVTGVAYLSIVIAFNPFGLEGTVWIIMFALMAQFMVYAVRATNSAMRSIGQELEEAAEIAGANFASILREVFAPLIRSGFISGYLIVFVDMMKVLSIPLLLAGRNNEVLAAIVFQYGSAGYPQLAASAATIMIFTIGSVYWLVDRYTEANVTSI